MPEESAATTLALDPNGAATVSFFQRIAGLLLVLAVAFLGSLFSSISTVRGAHYTYPDPLLVYGYVETLLKQLVSLALLAYVLRQNCQGMSDVGLAFRWNDMAHGVVLWGVTGWGYRLLLPHIILLCERLGWHLAAPYLPSAKLGFGLLTLCFVVVNPIFEEMIVRGYLMSETIVLTGNTTLAVLLSSLLQTSYHLYQGLPYALGLGLVFLVFSIYFARTRRILPILVAHFLADFLFH